MGFKRPLVRIQSLGPKCLKKAWNREISGFFLGATSGRMFQRVKVPNPPDSGKDIAKSKGVPTGNLKEAGGKSPAWRTEIMKPKLCKNYPMQNICFQYVQYYRRISIICQLFRSLFLTAVYVKYPYGFSVQLRFKLFWNPCFYPENDLYTL